MKMNTKIYYDITIRSKKTKAEVTYIRCYDIQINSSTLSFSYYSITLEDSFFCQFNLREYELDIRN